MRTGFCGNPGLKRWAKMRLRTWEGVSLGEISKEETSGHIDKLDIRNKEMQRVKDGSKSLKKVILSTKRKYEN